MPLYDFEAENLEALKHRPFLRTELTRLEEKSRSASSDSDPKTKSTGSGLSLVKHSLCSSDASDTSVPDSGSCSSFSCIDKGRSKKIRLITKCRIFCEAERSSCSPSTSSFSLLSPPPKKLPNIIVSQDPEDFSSVDFLNFPSFKLLYVPYEIDILPHRLRRHHCQHHHHYHHYYHHHYHHHRYHRGVRSSLWNLNFFSMVRFLFSILLRPSLLPPPPPPPPLPLLSSLVP
ncbi:hypothetical protein GQX74_011388 [Glossina fuscipes]|nr:hypothetical protein GQX74_011388 [Glossina fuscipes]